MEVVAWPEEVRRQLSMASSSRMERQPVTELLWVLQLTARCEDDRTARERRAGHRGRL
jgi:hypothetical protein